MGKIWKTWIYQRGNGIDMSDVRGAPSLHLKSHIVTLLFLTFTLHISFLAFSHSILLVSSNFHTF